MSQTQHEPDQALSQRIRRSVASAFNLYSIVIVAAFAILFAWYFPFTGNNDIIFLEHKVCHDTIEGIMGADPLKDHAILVYSHTTLYPQGHVPYWHENLRRLQSDSLSLAVLYANHRCYSGSALETYRYRRFVRQHNLHGYHASPIFSDSLAMIRRRSPVWLISADRSWIFEDLWHITDYDELKESILEQLSASQIP